MADARDGADAQRRWLVGPGGLLRPVEDLRIARASRHGARELPRRRPVEPWRMVERRRAQARTGGLRQRDGGALPGERAGAVLRALPQGEGRAAGERSADVQNRRQRVGAARRVAADAQGHQPASVFPRRAQALVRSACRSRGCRVRQLRLGSRESGPLPPPADTPERRMVDVAGRRSTVRSSPTRRARLVNRAARNRRHRVGQDRREPLRLHDRHRQRLDREVDRRVPGPVCERPRNGRVSTDDCRRRLPWAISPQLREP